MIKSIYKKTVSEKRRISNRLLFNKITSIFYRGNKFECNVCNRKFRKFHSKGNLTIRENAECPFCGSMERTRLLLFYLRNETNIFTEKNSLLHFAPEWGLRDIFIKCKKIHYINADINPDYADTQMDITNISYPDNSFDYIICSHVLGHVTNEAKAIQEMKRVLKPDGVALILTIINWNNPETYELKTVKTPEERLKHYSEPDLERLHGADFSKRLQEQGFKVEVINYSEKMGNEKCNRFSLGNGDREIIFKCSK